MKKSIFLLTMFMLLAFFGWSQIPQRNMVTDVLISDMETSIGDLIIDQEDQVINAYYKYVKDSRQASATTKQQVLVDYQAEVKRILTPQKYAILAQNPKMKTNPAFKSSAPQH